MVDVNELFQDFDEDGVAKEAERGSAKPVARVQSISEFTYLSDIEADRFHTDSVSTAELWEKISTASHCDTDWKSELHDLTVYDPDGVDEDEYFFRRFFDYINTRDWHALNDIAKYGSGTHIAVLTSDEVKELIATLDCNNQDFTKVYRNRIGPPGPLDEPEEDVWERFEHKKELFEHLLGNGLACFIVGRR